jgi:hypothetical protein
MNLRCKLLLIAFTAEHSFVLAQPIPAQTAGTETCIAPAIPAEVSSYLKVNFPGWRIKQPQDLREARYEWLSAYKIRRCPGVAIGNFQPGRDLTYAFLVVPEQGPNPHKDCRLLVVTTVGGRLSSRVIFSQGNRDKNVSEDDLYIRPINLAAFERRFANFPKTVDEGPFHFPVPPDMKEGIYLRAPDYVIFWKSGDYQCLQTDFRDDFQ